jgi:hypothetical protein
LNSQQHIIDQHFLAELQAIIKHHCQQIVGLSPYNIQATAQPWLKPSQNGDNILTVQLEDLC